MALHHTSLYESMRFLLALGKKTPGLAFLTSVMMEI